eukprot:TRINITY_DN4023_c0_g1_i2.p1 TRINITY_DN4023_c0_g1~~TRINITY_DN4023_c0_g1_i2.p1  ORF type:complete len:211 (-),score=31.87 TRINITY_DN4023_c0_g1_i2:329-961(-)
MSFSNMSSMLMAPTMGAIEKFDEQLKKNPTHPFQRMILTETLEFRVRYTIFYVSVAGVFLSVLLIILLSTYGLSSSAYFLWPVGSLVLSLYGIFTYREERCYILDEANQRYIFKLGNQVVIEGPLHNIYIRLRKQIDSARTYYYLILNGYRIDKYVLTGTSENMNKMRSLGQKLAHNLRINYFDEANISAQHRVLHVKKDKSTLTLTGIP